MSTPAQPIIVKKKKGGHGGHHGGAWKVAYADFVTAMMALFIVLWLMNASDRVQKAIGGYFKDPTGKGKMVGTGLAGIGESLSVRKDDLHELKGKLEKTIYATPTLNKLKDQVEMMVTGEGLRLELLETETGTFFESGRPQPSVAGRELLEKLAEELGKLPNSVLIEGHTDARPFAHGEDGYGNWELSAERANAARKVMQASGVRADQVKQVRGYADQHLRNRTDPNDASNRRITVIVQYQDSEEPVGRKAGENDKRGEKEPAAEHGKAGAEKPEPAKPAAEHH